MLSNEWSIKDFYPIAYIPNGVRLTAYGGDWSDLPAAVLQRLLDATADGRFAVPIHHVYDGLDQVRQAHTDMESTPLPASSSCESPELIDNILSESRVVGVETLRCDLSERTTSCLLR